jgi:hypothetical protein
MQLLKYKHQVQEDNCNPLPCHIVEPSSSYLKVVGNNCNFSKKIFFPSESYDAFRQKKI